MAFWIFPNVLTTARYFDKKNFPIDERLIQCQKSTTVSCNVYRKTF